MAKYDVFEHPAKGYEAVKCGFSWPAFFFAVPWAFVKRLWSHAMLALCLLVVLAVMPEFTEFERRTFGKSGLGLVLGLAFGINGNDWRRKRLEALGWRLAATVEADDPSQAIANAKERATV